jgi:PAS domain S-box-containing protein
VTSIRVLYLEDNPMDADLAVRELARQRGGWTLAVATTLGEARARLAETPGFDVVLTDMRLPDGTGLELLAEIRARGIPSAVVMLTGTGDESTAIAALKAGADDYLVKTGHHLGRLPSTLEAALGRFRSESARRAVPLRVLFGGDRADHADRMRRHLEQEAPHVRLEIVSHALEVLEHLPRVQSEECAWDVLLLDVGDLALEVLKILRGERRLDLPVVVLSATGGEDSLVQALRLGATDYLVKHAAYLTALPAVLSNAKGHVMLAREREALRESQARLSAQVERLRESEERFRQLTDNIQEVFWMTDPGKNQMLYVSPAYEKIWGRSPDTLYADARTWLDAIHPEDRERVLHAAAAVSRQATGDYDEEYRIVRFDASERWIHDRAFPVRNELGQVYRIVGVAEDVTARHAAEEERRQLVQQFQQSQKLEAIGRLAGGVAHDFNNMLGVILGNVELALKNPERSLEKRLQEIHAAATRSADLTRQLLAFSRRQAIAPRRLVLNRQLEGMERLLRRIIGEDIELRLELDSEPWPVSMDPTQIDQVLANLAVNARDAMPDGGSLTIETANVTLDEAQCRLHPDANAGDHVMLAVSDSGVGMDGPTLQRAFEPFFTTKPEGEGTGLGLATVYGIARQNGGWVNLYSELGRGTTVKLYLPRDRGPQEAPAVTSAPRERVAREGVVLLVEDEDSLREVGRELLVELGYTVLAAGSAAEALELCRSRSGPIDLLLTDVVMPSMNGKELAEQVRSLKPGIRVIYMSGYTAKAVEHRGVLDPGIPFLQKPFSLDTLESKVREILGPR